MHNGHLESRSVAPDNRPEADQPAWRRDFPIDTAQDHYVVRREFTKFLGLASLGFAVGQVWILLQSWWRGREQPPSAQRIAGIHELTPGTARSFRFPHDHNPCLLLRLANGTFVAYEQKCTHLSCAVVPELERGRLFCPCHNGSFECQTGRPLSGPPRRPLARITLEIRAGEIFATGVELRTV